MRKLIIALLTAFCFLSLSSSAQYKIAILGSGAAAGSGASVTDSAWATRLQAFYRRNMSDGLDTTITNYSAGFMDTYRARENGYVPPAGRAEPVPGQNITTALGISPNRIIINFPSSEIEIGNTLAQTMENLRQIRTLGVTAGAQVWITTTYPNNNLGGADDVTQRAVKDSIVAQFPTSYIDLWTDLVDADDLTLKASVTNETVHPNDLGHRLIFLRIAAGPSVDVTPPTLQGAVVSLATPNQIVATFSEPVTATTDGWSFRRNGSNWPVSSISGSGTSWTFTMSTSAVAGEALDASYSSTTGNTVDGSSNELATFSNFGISNGLTVTYQIPIPTNKPFDANFYNINFDETKNIKRIFDGNVATGINSSGSDNQFAGNIVPYQSFIVLDSIYNISSFDWWIGSNNGGVRTLFFYDSLRQQIGDSVNITITGGFNSWMPATGIVRNGAKFIEVRIRSILGVNDGMNELRFFGNSIGPTGTILPTTVHNPASIVDHGVYAIGFNDVGDRWNRTSQSDITDTLYRRMGKVVRWYPLRNELDRFPEAYYGGLRVAQPMLLNRQGPTNNLPYFLSLLQRWGMHSQYAAGGPSLKSYDFANVQNNSVWMGSFTPTANNWRYMELDANPEIDTSHAAGARQLGNVVSLYGNNPSAPLTTTVTGGSSAVGQNIMTQAEWDNEPTRFWQHNYYHTAKAYVAASRAYYDSVKAKAPNFPALAAAHISLSYEFWKAIYFWNYWTTGSKSYPADGFAFNCYISTAGFGQGADGNATSGVSPENAGAWAQAQNIRDFGAIFYPNRFFNWTEFGYDFRAESPYEAPAIGSKTARQVAADWETRLKAIMQTTRAINRMYNYAFFQDFTGNFGGMAMVGDEINFTRAAIFPKGYAQAQEIYVERDYNWFSGVIQNGGNTGVSVTMKDHRTDPNKKLVKVWMGTANGSTANQVVNVTNATSAKMYNLRYDSYLPDSSNLVVTNNQFTVPASEAMSWVEVTLTPNQPTQPPVANAGPDQTINAPSSQVTLDGSGTDPDGTVVAYSWVKLTGTGGTITSPSNATTTVTGLSVGTYTFELTVTDNQAATGKDTVTIIVNALPTVSAGNDQTISLPTNTVTLSATASDSDGTIQSYSWTKLTGGGGSISTPTTASTLVTALQQGSYTFRVVVTDNRGAQSADTVAVTVNPDPSPAIRVTRVQRRIGFAPYRITVYVTYQDATTQAISNQSGSPVSNVWERSELLDGQQRPTAWIKFANGNLRIIRRKGD